MLLSVVVPIYNGESTLRKCIDSIIHQKYKDVEIILINDGSSDQSRLICDSYVKEYSNIEVCHINHQGLVASRKIGCELANGELITFVDCDDWIESDMYLKMMNIYSDFHPDVITSGLIYDYGNSYNTEIDLYDEGYYDYGAKLEKIIPTLVFNTLKWRRGINSSLCTKIFKTRVIKEALRDMDENISFGEDAAIVYPAIANANSLYISHNCWYHYMIHDNSMVRNYDIESFGKIKKLQQYLTAIFQNSFFYKEIKQQINYYINTFLETAIKEVYGFVNPVEFVFPFESIPYKSRIVIYGAGKVGKSYYNYLNCGCYSNIVAWVDKNYKEIGTLYDYDISSPAFLVNKDYDFIVIAIEDEIKALQIIEQLESIGIERAKILWVKPKRIVVE